MRNIYKIIVVVVMIATTIFFLNQKDDILIESFNIGNLKRTFQLDYNTTIDIGNRVKDNFTFSSKVDMYAFRYQDDNIVAISFSDIKINRTNLQDLYHKLFKEILFLKISPNGTMNNFRFYYNEENYRNIKQILYTFETILKKDKEYSVMQKDENGVIKVKYTRDKNTLLKMRIKYSNSDVKIVSSEIYIDIDRYWITDLKGEESYQILLRDTKVRNSFTLKQLEKNSGSLFELSEDELIKIYKSYDNNKKVNIIEEFKEKNIIKKLKNTPLDINSSSKTISYHIKANKNEEKEIKELIKNSKDKKVRLKLIEALRKSATFEAQDTLMEIVRDDEFTRNDKVDALVSLGFIDNPKENLTDFLFEIYYGDSEELSSTAILAVGNLYHYIQDEYKKEEIVNNIKNEYASSPKDSISLLRAMQNIDASKFKNEIYNSLESDNFFEKYNAINIISDIDNPETREKLLWIINNPKLDDELKESAKKTLKKISKH